ncbi:MAG: AMIN domain-containing protein, partial [Pseudomonadota bacterium]
MKENSRGKKINLQNKGIASLRYLIMGFLMLSGCVSVSERDSASIDESKMPVIESVKVSPSPGQTLVEIVNSKATPYTAFSLVNPPRIILDLRGIAGENLPPETPVHMGNIRDIRFEKGKTQTMTTRMIIGLEGPVKYEAAAEDHLIKVTLNPEPLAAEIRKTAPQVPSTSGAEPAEATDGKGAPSEPRIFVKGSPSGVNKVLGVDFTMLSHGKSRIIVTMDKKCHYNMDRKGSRTLILELAETTIPPQILREIDSSQFEGAVERIKPMFSPGDKKTSIAIMLKEMVPFHIQQQEKEITVDFGRPSIEPVQKK